MLGHVVHDQRDSKILQHYMRRDHRLEASVDEIQHIIDNADNLELDL